VVVAFVHWGTEYEPVADRTRATAAKLADAGVDVVIGHHSHVPQAIGEVDDVPVLYGLGNAAFGSRGRFERGEGIGLVARLVTAGGAVQRIELITVRTDNRRVNFATAAMGPKESAQVLQRLAAEGPVELQVVDGVGVLEV
jgi:poly-gamma-glutamate capsule biosynthesis protein CapA/YwtB (metallophosphatase superfamily)